VAQLQQTFVEFARAAAFLFREGRTPVSVNFWYSYGSSWQSGLGSESLSPPEWESALAGALRSAIAGARQSREPVRVTVHFSDHSTLEYGLPAESSLAWGVNESQCKQDIIRVLQAKNHRLTTAKVLQELLARDLLWGESTVKRALAKMVRDNELTNRTDVRPRGYGLPVWT
jgi:hypothetical protein